MRDEVASLEVPQGLADRFGPFRDDPVRFIEDVLGAEPEPYQVAILKAAVEAPRIAWRAGHGVGKTTTIARLAPGVNRSTNSLCFRVFVSLSLNYGAPSCTGNQASCSTMRSLELRYLRIRTTARPLRTCIECISAIY